MRIKTRPNIVFAFADDWGRYASAYAAHQSPGNLNELIDTPNFDRVAGEGILFTNALVPAPSCTPCRSSLLSGRYFWQTGLGAILVGAVWDESIPTFPLSLEADGYFIGHTYKVWSPGQTMNAPMGGVRTNYNEAGLDFNQFSHWVTRHASDFGTGTNGIGVILVESAKSLQSIVQLLTSPFNKDNEYTDLLLQEQIKTDYDVRVIVLKDEVIGAIKRPVVKGDFRSNVSQGSIPLPHKLTKLEEEESLRAARAVDGILVGVDFIPSKNREKDSPYFLEVNNVPGLSGIEEALKSEGSVVKAVLTKLHDRSLWANA